jgi:hypothetical protein
MSVDGPQSKREPGTEETMRCREQIAGLRAAGVEWATLGPQRVGEQDLLHQAGLVTSELAPR